MHASCSVTVTWTAASDHAARGANMSGLAQHARGLHRATVHNVQCARAIQFLSMRARATRGRL